MKDQFQVRRRMAKSSFAMINILTVLVLGVVFFGSSLVAGNLTAASPILIALIGVLVLIVGHYSHMVYSTYKRTKEENDVGTNSNY